MWMTDSFINSECDWLTTSNTTAHLVAEFARIQIEVPSEFWRIQLRMDRRCAVVLTEWLATLPVPSRELN